LKKTSPRKGISRSSSYEISYELRLEEKRSNEDMKIKFEEIKKISQELKKSKIQKVTQKKRKTIQKKQKPI